MASSHSCIKAVGSAIGLVMQYSRGTVKMIFLLRNSSQGTQELRIAVCHASFVVSPKIKSGDLTTLVKVMLTGDVIGRPA